MASPTVEQLPASYQSKIYQEPTSGCWIWLGSVNPHGYGRKRVAGTTTGAVKNLHRDVYERLVGPIPVGLTLDHKCRVRCCCNPGHLEPVTTQVNTARGEKNQYSKKQRCPKGHPYDGENLILYYKRGKGPYRQCRECKKEALARWHRREGNISAGTMDIRKRDRNYSLGKPLLRGNLALKC